MSPRALELRIHGVNNTPPAAMLALPDHAVEQFLGDRFGSFWRPLPAKVAELPVGHPGVPRAEVEREAYSWGGMARSTPGAPGSGVASVVANTLGRVGWALLLPFGLANVAYWSRAIPRNWTAEDEREDTDVDSFLTRLGHGLKAFREESGVRPAWQAFRKALKPAERPKAERWWWNAGRGAASTRLFGLGLTLLLVLSVCAVAIDFHAVQCSLPGATCRRLPEWLDLLDNPAQHIRVLAASAVPVLLLVGLLLLTSLSRNRYELAPVKDDPRFRPGVLFSRKQMWQGSPRLRRLTRLHLAAGFCVVTLVTSVQLVGQETYFWYMTAIAGGLLIVVAARVVLTATDCPDAPKNEKGGVWSWGLVVTTGLLLAAHGFGLLGFAPTFSGPLRVTEWGPPAVTGALLAIALSAWSWRKPRKREGVRFPFRLVVGLAFVVCLALTRVAPVWWLGAVAAGVALIVFAWGGNHEWQAWRGTGPGVLLGLSLTSSLVVSTVLVLTVRNWLSGEKALSSAPFYSWFAGSFAAALALLLALVVVLALVLGWRLLAPTEFLAKESLGTPPGKKALVMRWRHVIASAHRAEVVVGVLSAFSTVATGLAVYVSFAEPAWRTWRFPSWVVEQGVLVTGLAGVAVIGSFVGAGVLANRRPLGLLWDLMCFLPRTAHPFAPPCYAERAVPEIAGRVREWLDGHPGSEERPVVVLSAHSLGAVLAVATLYALPENHLKRVKLLTYGVQLRPYFGRIFPELLGPDVLGTPACRGGTLWRLNPWHRAPGDTTAPGEHTVLKLMEGRWINLWRRTDYLGFPVVSWDAPDAESVDQWADETNGSPDKVETHSDYHLCPSYEEAFNRLVPDQGAVRPASAGPGQGHTSGEVRP